MSSDALIHERGVLGGGVKVGEMIGKGGGGGWYGRSNLFVAKLSDGLLLIV